MTQTHPRVVAIALFAVVYFLSPLQAEREQQPGSASISHGLRLIEEPSVARSARPAVAAEDIFPEEITTRRHRPIALNPKVGQRDGFVEGDALDVSLFASKSLRAKVDRVTENVNGTVTVRARIDGYPLSYILISTTDGQSLGSISIPETGEFYHIQGDRLTGDHYLADVERMEALPSDCENLLPPTPTPEELAEMGLFQDEVAGDALEHVIVDVMVVYTPAANNWAASAGGMANIIAQAMEKGNLALENSGTFLTWRLTHSAQVNYVESGSSGADLRRLTTSPTFSGSWGDWYNDHYMIGYMDEVHDWRDMYGADLVAIFAQVSDTGGLAWRLNWAPGQPQYGFSLTRVQQAGSTFTHGHEMGHNMGLGHHKEQNSVPGPGLSGYSAGWRWVGNDGNRHCSVMSYEGGNFFSDGFSHVRVAHFSNPAITHFGAPTGDVADGDSARTLRETKHVVAGYRAATVPISIGFAVGTSDWNWQTGGDAPWFGQTGEYYSGGASARSGSITDGQESWIETEVQGPGTLSFWWKVSSEDNGDFLTVLVEGQEEGQISGDVDWQQMAVAVPFGLHTVSWAYTKNGSASAGSDAAWLDALEWTPGPISIGDAVGQPDWEWWTSGNAPWFGQSGEYHSEGASARSGSIGHSQESRLETLIEGPGTLSFWWKVSSEGTFDFLRFYVGGSQQSAISGEVGWEQKTVPIPAGFHWVSWVYTKDEIISHGADAGWLDTVEWTPSAVISIGEAVGQPDWEWETGGHALWSGQAVDYQSGGASARSGAIGHDQYSWVETLIEGPGTLSFWWKVSSETGWDFLEFHVGGQLESEISGEVDWEQKTVPIPAGFHWVRWEYTKDGSVSHGADAGWLDSVVWAPYTPGPATFAEWAAEHFSAPELGQPEISGPAADPGGFGVPNLLRYAFGLDARAPSRLELPSAKVESVVDGGTEKDYLTISFSLYQTGSDLVYSVDRAANLATWQPLNLVEHLVAWELDGEWLRVTFRDQAPLEESDAGFLRVRVELD